MNHLVAAHSQTHLPLAQNLLKFLAALFVAAFSLAGSAFAAGTNSVSLAWDRNSETDVLGYRLQYGITQGTYPNVIDAGNTTTARATGLNQGTTYFFTVVAYNTAGQTSPASSVVTYTVPGEPNTAPTANSFFLTVAEDGQAAATASGDDGEGDTLAFSIVSAPTKGTLTGTAPNWIYKPAANANGSDSFTYRANDGALNSANATISITITPVNDAPVADAKSLTVQEDGTLAVTLSGSDVDGDALTYTILTAPTKGTLIGTAPNLTYTPGANLNGSDSFTYRVNDGTTNSATVTVNIVISAVNDIPVANAQSLTTAEDTPRSITLSGTDLDGGALTYAITTAPTKGTLSGTAPNLTYTPAANFNGSDSFVFRVNDGTANSPTATVSLTVTPVNDAPVATSRTLGTTSNMALAVTLAGTDVEGSPLTYAIVSSPKNGALSGTAPNLTYTPATSFLGSDSFTYRVNDGSLNSAVATVTIDVISSNRSPQAHGKLATTMKSKAVAVTLTGSDPDSDSLSFRIVNGPVDGTLTGTPPNVTYTPVAKWTGNDKFTYVANDGKTDSPVATVDLKVKSTNKKPVATGRSATVHQNSAGTITLAGTDPDGDNLTFSIAKKPANGSITGTSPNFVYVPKSGFKGKDSFTFTAHDGTVKSAPAVVSISVVNPNNRAPRATALTLRGPAKAVVPVALGGSDPDGDALTFRIVSKPTSGKLTGKGSAFKYKPAAKFSGVVTFTYVASDGSLESAPTLVTITIDPPVARARSIAEKSKDDPQVVPSLAVSGSSTRGVILTLTGPPGQSCTLQYSTNLTGWTDLQQIDIPGTGIYTFEVSPPEGSSRGFFRLDIPD